MNSHVDVALILCNPDVIEVVSIALLRHDLNSLGVEPSEETGKIESLLVSWKPDVIVFDLHPPYGESAAFLRRLMRRFPHCPFVMTCADAAYALKQAPWLSRHPMFQKPYAPDAIANSVFSLVNVAQDRTMLPTAAVR
jgi:chemotaxis response regulator CheB